MIDEPDEGGYYFVEVLDAKQVYRAYRRLLSLRNTVSVHLWETESVVMSLLKALQVTHSADPPEGFADQMNPYDALRQLYDYANRGGLPEEALEACYEAVHAALPAPKRTEVTQ